MAGTIFLNYRRSDAEAWADRLLDQLKNHLPMAEVFLDIDGNIPLGLPFSQWIEDKVATCDMMLVLINQSWTEKFLERSNMGSADHVLVEIESALARKIPVVPVFLGDTPVPSPTSLPESIRPLLDLQATRLQRSSFEADIRGLCNGIVRSIELTRLNSPAPMRPTVGPQFGAARLTAFNADELIAAALSNSRSDRSAPIRYKMKQFCEELRKLDWATIPERYRNNRVINDAHGRCAVVFSDEDGWHPGICLGFYYCTEDHRVQFADAKWGIDLHIRIQAAPTTNPKPEGVIRLLEERATSLRALGPKVLFKGQPGNGNSHTLCFIHKNLLELINNAPDANAQLALIGAELSKWCDTLFRGNTELVGALGTLRNYPN